MTISTEAMDNMDAIVDRLGDLDGPEGDERPNEESVEGSEGEEEPEQDENNNEEEEEEEEDSASSDEDLPESGEADSDEKTSEDAANAGPQELGDADMARTLKFKSNGAEVELPLSKIVELAQKGDNYSANQQKLKQRRAELEAQHDARQKQVQAQAAAALQTLTSLKAPYMQQIQQLMGNPPSDLDDQGAWAAKMTQARAAVDYYDNTFQQVMGTFQQAAAEQARQYVDAQTKAVVEAVPDWGAAHTDMASSVLQEFGVQDSSTLSAGTILGAYELAKARKEIAELKAAAAKREETHKKNKVRKSKPVPAQVPKKRGSQKPRSNRSRARQRLHQERSIDAAAALFGDIED